MKGFVFKLLIYVLVALAVLVVADYALSGWMRKVHHPNNEIWDEVMEGKVDADVIALGSSRANTAFYPPVVDSVLETNSWNLGVLGHHFQAEDLRYKMYRLHNRKPRLVVQFVDPLIFSSGKEFDRVQFLPWFWDKAFRKSFRDSFGSDFFFKNAFPFVRYHSFLPWEVAYDGRCTEKGFHTYEPDRKDPLNSAFKEFLAQDEDLMDRFVSFLFSLKEDGIEVVMVYPPEYKTIVYEDGQREATRSCMDSIAKLTQTPYIDYSNMVLCSDSTNFIDVNHLNLKGAIEFSDSLSNDIRRIISKERE